MQPHGFTNLGGLDKKPDQRDIKLGAVGAPVYTFPKTLTNSDAWKMEVENQGPQPACGAHAGAELKDLSLHMRATPRFTWGDLKTFDGWPIDMGTDNRSVMKSITKSGVLDFSQLGNDVSLPEVEYAKAPTAAQRALAVKHAGMGYGFIQDLSFNGIKQFISDHGPSIVTVRVGKEWWTGADGIASWAESKILPLRAPAVIVSGHFVVAHSYDEQFIYFINHWSDGWGRKGHGYFGADYMPFVTDAGALFPLQFKKDLFFGMTDPDVLDLQRYLNSHGSPVAATGAGSSGNETNYFGPATKAAVIHWQTVNGISPAAGYFGPLSRAFATQHP